MMLAVAILLILGQVWAKPTGKFFLVETAESVVHGLHEKSGDDYMSLRKMTSTGKIEFYCICTFESSIYKFTLCFNSKNILLLRMEQGVQTPANWTEDVL